MSRLLVAIFLAFLLHPHVVHAGTGCADLLPPPDARHARRDITAIDLARLRDIGRPDSGAGGASPLALSPDGTKLAFILQRADPPDNSFCRALVVLPLKGRGGPRIVDVGGEPILVTFDNQRGMVFPTGIQAIVTPQWSPDGARIAYLRRDGGRTRVRIVNANGGKVRDIGEEGADIDQVRWSRTGAALILANRPGITAEQKAIDAEGRHGFLFDRRVMPVASSRPFPPGPVPYVFRKFELETGTSGPAAPDEQLLFPDIVNTTEYQPAILKSQSPSGWRIWIRQTDPHRYPSPELLEAQGPDGHTMACTIKACASGIIDGWWSETEGAMLFMRREGWGGSMLGLYRWRPGAMAARRLLSTDAVLVGCRLSVNALLCLKDASSQPRRIVTIDTHSGRERLVFDPNPEFRDLRLGPVRRLHWKTAAGVEGFGDLVLPPDHRPGQKHPMVIVQYRTRGFLRGGTGDEYPIFALAAHGMAVLSFEEPPEYALSVAHRLWTDYLSSDIEDTRNWNDRRNILQSLMKGIDTAVALGEVDRNRIGISGLSDGATTVQFALVNANIFKAAAVSSCCEDPHSFLMLAGEAFSSLRQKTGFPPISGDKPGFWKDYSLSPNADRIDTPLLMQLADGEYLISLEAYWALRERGKPVELHIFPDEYHIKWQPAHRLAIYRRNIDWFDYWLQDRIDPASDKQEQYRRWDALRAGGPPDPDSP